MMLRRYCVQLSRAWFNWSLIDDRTNPSGGFLDRERVEVDAERAELAFVIGMTGGTEVPLRAFVVSESDLFEAIHGRQVGSPLLHACDQCGH